MLLFWPDTNGLPLEEIAAIFGDGEEVAIYQADIEFDRNTHSVVVRKRGGLEKGAQHMESVHGSSEDVAERV